VDPSILSTSNRVYRLAQVVAPANPYATVTDLAITTVFGCVGTVAAYIARRKTKALNSLASHIVQTGATEAALEMAANTPHFSTIANALANQTPNDKLLLPRRDNQNGKGV